MLPKPPSIDVYVVDVLGDVVVEAANAGTDDVRAGFTYSLGALTNVENLRLTGTGVINATGNAGNNVLIGNAAANFLNGSAGNDGLNAGVGNDTLTGCISGANGGRGESDTLTGGVGNDVFQLGFANERFYDDGAVANAARNDYALITDFTVGQDKLQLDGAKGNYFLGASGVAGVVGSGLFHDSNANAKLDTIDELIAIVRSANSTALNAANTINTANFV